jgi:hypothetical protein
MRTIVRYVFVALIGLAAAVAAVAAAGPAQAQPTPKSVTGPIRDGATGLVLPQTLGGLELTWTIDFESIRRGLGVSYRYRDPADPFNLDLYIYNKGATIPSGVTEAIVVQEVDAAVNDVRGATAQGVYQNLNVTDTSATCRYGDLPFRCVTFRFESRGQRVQSLLLLRGDKGNFIKVRATWREDDIKAADSVHRWVTAFAGLLKK